MAFSWSLLKQDITLATKVANDSVIGSYCNRIDMALSTLFSKEENNSPKCPTYMYSH